MFGPEDENNSQNSEAVTSKEPIMNPEIRIVKEGNYTHEKKGE